MNIFKHKKPQHSTRHFAVCGILEIDGKILFVRHTYGTAKDRILLPGGYVKEKELPTRAVEREFFEETSVVCRAGEIYSVQFKPEEWCIVFTLDYVSGETDYLFEVNLPFSSVSSDYTEIVSPSLPFLNKLLKEIENKKL